MGRTPRVWASPSDAISPSTARNVTTLRPRPSPCIRSRDGPEMSQRFESDSRAGARMPLRADCATSVIISAVTNARRFPVAERSSRRLAQPRASTMHTPNINPPMIAHDMLPARKLHGGGTQAELRALRGHAEQKPRHQTGHQQNGSVAKPVKQDLDHLKALDARPTNLAGLARTGR